ncbi:MAG: molybdopterin-dependent oxidoreductase [Adlercreutzia equolifaciens]
MGAHQLGRGPRLIAGEIKRVMDTYGNEGILLPGGVPQRLGDFDIGRMMYLMGGCLEQNGAVSSGAWTEMAKLIGLTEDTNDRMDLRTSELIVLWASNPAWSRAGLPTYDYMQCKAAGTKFISVDVFYNPTARALTDEFIAVRPGTDTAMLLAWPMLLTQDDPEKNPLIDWDFLDRCTIGFDADHARRRRSEGQLRRLCAWHLRRAAEGPCLGLRDLRRPGRGHREGPEIARTERCAHHVAGPGANRLGAQLCQALLSFGAMAGIIGKPGCCAASDCGHAWMQGGWKQLHEGGTYLGCFLKDTVAGPEYIENPLSYKKVNVNQMWTSIVNEEEYIGVDGNRYENPAHLIYDRHENFLNQGPATMLGIEAYRKMDTVIAQNLVMTTTCKYADIVLPISSMWERYGIFEQAYREQLIWTSQVVEPLFECRSDMDVALALADRLGVDKEALCPEADAQAVFNTVAAAKVLNEDNETWDNLVTITEDDLATLGVEGTPQEGRVPILDFKRDGIYTIERTPDDGRNFVPFQAFREDPEANALKTESGKLEIYCRAASEKVHGWGFAELDPICKYVPPTEGYEETFADWETKEKGEYPFQILSLHILRHSHSTFANVPYLREAFDHPLYMIRRRRGRGRSDGRDGAHRRSGAAACVRCS